ncbi:MAG: NAD-dependent epimerase/dehydratase family protein [Verrucomicrobiota bacterium]
MIDYLITGGAGFIGSNLAEHLVAHGKTVRIFDDFSSGRRENIVGLTGKAEVVTGSLCDLPAIQRATNGVMYVIHMGAIPSVPRSVQAPAETNAANITGTLNVLIAARDAGVKRLVLSSSSSIYGESPTLPKHEEMTPSPLSPYAIHKITGEYYCRVFYQLYGLETVSLRYFNVFGPRQNPASQYAAVIPRFITAVLQNESPTIFGDGQQTRDFSHVQNVIEANLAACAAGKAACGESFNIACGGRISLLDLVAAINAICGKQVKPKFEPGRAGDIKDSQAAIDKAARLLGWKPSVDFRAGIEKAVAWYRAQLTTG